MLRVTTQVVGTTREPTATGRLITSHGFYLHRAKLSGPWRHGKVRRWLSEPLYDKLLSHYSEFATSSPCDLIRSRLRRQSKWGQLVGVGRRQGRPVCQERWINTALLSIGRTGLILQTLRNKTFNNLDTSIRNRRVADQAQHTTPRNLLGPLPLTRSLKPSSRPLVFSPRNIEQVRAERLRLPGLEGLLNRLREASPDRTVTRVVDQVLRSAFRCWEAVEFSRPFLQVSRQIVSIQDDRNRMAHLIGDWLDRDIGEEANDQISEAVQREVWLYRVPETLHLAIQHTQEVMRAGSGSCLSVSGE